MNNPFSLSFGKKPLQYISRISQTEELVNKLDSSTPSSQAYMEYTSSSEEVSPVEDDWMVELNDAKGRGN